MEKLNKKLSTVNKSRQWRPSAALNDQNYTRGVNIKWRKTLQRILTNQISILNCVIIYVQHLQYSNN